MAKIRWFRCVVAVALLLVPAAPLAAGEHDDARVAFGAYADGLYAFAAQELDSFLQRYPDSDMIGRVRLTRLLCALALKDCDRAATLLPALEKTAVPPEFGVAAPVSYTHLTLPTKRIV